MKGLRKFGAMALAAALTVTFVVPTTAKAASDSHYGNNETTFYDYDKSGTYDADGDFTTSSETYRNKITGETYTYDMKTHKSTGDYYKATKSYFGNVKKLQVGVKSNYRITLRADPGETFDGSLKIKSGKENLSVKQAGKVEKEVLPQYDSEAKQYYFEKLDGSKEFIGELKSSDEIYDKKRTQYAYTYILFGKKAGAAKLQYKINNQKFSIKVTVTADARPFSSISFAGKSYQLDYNTGATNANYYAKQSENKAGNFYTTKKKGKFKVSMNKNYKFVAMYVIKDTDYETVNDNGAYYDESYLRRKRTKGIDLNGDGDFEDIIDGIHENIYTSSTFVKYNKKSAKITLNTSVDEANDTATYYYDDTKTKSRKVTETYKGNYADTDIIIVYQNKLTQGYGARPITLTYCNNK